MMQTASISPNEIRTKEGMAPYPGGDRMFVAVNNFTPADRLDEVIDSQVKKSQSNSQGSNNKNIETPKASELELAITEFLRKR
jgi:hypothetical protein